MSGGRAFTRSMAGGEITPELYGRLDQVAHATGLKTCENAVVLPHGPATCRPGFEYVQTAKRTDQVRLAPFSFNTEQTYILEFGEQYMRVHTNGATLLEAAQTLISVTADPFMGVVTYAGADPANDTWVYIQASSVPELHNRFVVVKNVVGGSNTFTPYDLFGNPIPIAASWGGPGAQMAPVFEISTPYAASDVFDLNYTQNADILTIVHPDYPVYELSRLSASSFSLDAAVFTPGIDAPDNVSAVATSGTGTLVYDYVVTAVHEDNFEESVASTNNSCTNTLTTSGNYNTITWDAVAEAVRYNVYRKDRTTGNSLFGYIGQTDGLSFEDQNIVPDMSATPPIYENPFSGVGDYPRAVSYFEQRKVFASTTNRLQNYWMTRNGTERNLSRSLPTIDTDAIFQRLVAREVNEIRHLVPLTELLVFTSGGVWLLDGVGGAALTPVTVRGRPQAYEGAATQVPQTTKSSVLYVHAAGSRIYEINYSWESSSYTADDASIMAPHLVDDNTIQQIAWAGVPDQILWAVRDDGTLLGLTYVPKHEVRGWHKHVTQGSFKSAAVVKEGNQYAVYALVERFINGQTMQYLERMHTRRFTNLEDWFGVDSGLTYEGASASTVTGLWHLEGESVDILGDGAVLTPQTVTGGAVTLSTASEKAHIGLSYTPTIELLPQALQGPAGGQGRAKSPTHAWLRLYKSKGVLVSAAGTVELDDRSIEPYGSPTGMVNSEVDVLPLTSYDQDATISVSRQGPLPLTLVCLTLEVDVGG